MYFSVFVAIVAASMSKISSAGITTDPRSLFATMSVQSQKSPTFRCDPKSTGLAFKPIGSSAFVSTASASSCFVSNASVTGDYVVALGSQRLQLQAIDLDSPVSNLG